MIALGDPCFTDALVKASPLGRSAVERQNDAAEAAPKVDMDLGGWFDPSSEKIKQADPAFIDALLSPAPLHAAARRGDEVLARALVECGVLLEAKQRGLTPAEQAMAVGHRALAQWLSQPPGSKMDGVGADEKMAVGSIGTPDFAGKFGARRPEKWTPRDDAFWRGEAAEFKSLNRQMRERRFDQSEKASELDAACDMEDCAWIKEHLSLKRERLGMPTGVPGPRVKNRCDRISLRHLVIK